MTEYENAAGLVTDQSIKKYLDDEGYTTTDNIDYALYILRDGTMISGADEFGTRVEDHRMIECLISEGDNYFSKDGGDESVKRFWDALHAKTSMVRVAPEAKVGLISFDQKLTPQQEDILESNDYEIERY